MHVQKVLNFFIYFRRETPQHYALHMNHIAEDFVSLVASTRDSETNVLSGFKDLVYRAGLETVSNVALEKRMGFLDSKITARTQLILDSIQGYQVCYTYKLLNIMKHTGKALIGLCD